MKSDQVAPSHTFPPSQGGSQIPCTGSGEVMATVKAKASCTLITNRFREKAHSGPMKLTFRPELKEVAVDGAGVKAKF